MLDSDFPEPRGANDARSARAYRHPFLVNVGPSAPLRACMAEFIAEYKRMQVGPDTSPPWYGAALPDPDRFYFDTETLMTWAGGKDGWSRNQVYLLQQLATRTDDNSDPALHPERKYWNKQLPGHPAGTTLATLYNAAAPAYGWPTNILDTTNGLTPALSAEHERNHRYMIWYAGICNKVQDHIMKFCAYDVIKAAWPEHPILVGNYFDAKMDNAYDATGWHMGWEDPVAHTARTPVNVIRRGWVDPFWSGGHGWTMFLPAELGFLPPPMGVTESGRFLTIEHAASGDVDMPELYPLAQEQWKGEFNGGYGDDAGGPGQGQPLGRAGREIFPPLSWSSRGSVIY